MLLSSTNRYISMYWLFSDQFEKFFSFIARWNEKKQQQQKMKDLCWIVLNCDREMCGGDMMFYKETTNIRYDESIWKAKKRIIPAIVCLRFLMFFVHIQRPIICWHDVPISTCFIDIIKSRKIKTKKNT